MSILVNNIVQEVARRPEYTFYGRVSAVVGLLVEVAGLKGALSVGDHCRVVGRGGPRGHLRGGWLSGTSKNW